MFRLQMATVRAVVNRYILSLVNRLSLNMDIIKPRHVEVSFNVFVLL
jgi:hypothetical protein